MRFEHTFTHFRMRARVWRSELDETQAESCRTPQTSWLALADAASAPLPRPVKSLLLAVGAADLLSGATGTGDALQP
jgi:adenine-specific DNA glycosylase